MGLSDFLVVCHECGGGWFPCPARGFGGLVVGFHYRLLIRLSRGGGFGGLFGLFVGGAWRICALPLWGLQVLGGGC